MVRSFSIAAVTIFVSFGTFLHDAIANDPVLSVPLPKAESLHFTPVDEDTYQAIRSFTDVPSSEVSVTNIKPRSIIQDLQFISGQTKSPGQTVWFFLMSSERKSYELGSTVSNRNREFTINTSTLPKTIQGELFLVATLVPDFRLSIPLSTKTTIVPFYRNLEINSTIGMPEKLTILVEDIQFRQNEVLLKTLQKRFLEVYAHEEDKPLEITLRGQLFGSDLKKVQLTSIVLPTMQQDLQKFSAESPYGFEARIIAKDLKVGDDIEVILLASENTLPTLDQSSGSRSNNQIVHFLLRSASDYPNSFLIALRANSHWIVVVLLVFVILSCFIIFRSYREQSGWAKMLSLFIVGAEFAVLIVIVGNASLKAMVDQGLFQIPGQEQVIVRNTPMSQQETTLTGLNENLEIIPVLSTSWSNISPHVWEFVLRKGIESETVVLQLQRKIQTRSPDRQYLASVKNIVSVNPNKLQFVTHFPDPLLPQKMSKVIIEGQHTAEKISKPYLPLESYSNSMRAERSNEYFNLPFLKDPSLYQTVLRSPDLDSQKKLILTQKIDLFDEPETRLWPALLQNNYRIIPKINTESIVIMADRKSFFLNNTTMMLALKKLLNSPRILQTSYFQYGQLANQFTPPGVVGYIPNLETVIDERPAVEILSQAKKELGASEVTLTFQYPVEEKIVARVVQQELETAGITVVPIETNNIEYEQQLLKQTSDLTLIPLDFDVGDAGPFLDTLIDSRSPFNKTYFNAEVDQLIQESRQELNSFKRLELLQKIMRKIVIEDPAGIPLLFKRSFVAIKKQSPVSWWEKLLQRSILGWN